MAELVPASIPQSTSSACLTPQTFQAVQGLTLQAAQERLEIHNRALQFARSNLAFAQADQASAAARPNPVLSYNAASINPSSGIGAGNLLEKRIDQIVRIDQVIERGNKRALRLATATASVFANEAEYKNTQRQQTLNLQLAYYDLKLAQTRLAITRENAKLFADTRQRQQLRFQAGDLAGSELARIKVDALRAESDFQQAQSALRQAQSTLAILLGWEGCAPQLEVVDPWPTANIKSTDPSDPDSKVVLLAARRSDVQAAQQRLEAARQAQALANSLRTRDISVNAQYERFQPNSPNTYGLGISVPLFLGYNYRGEILRANAALDQADYEVQKTQQIAQEEIALAQQNYQNTKQRQQAYQTALLPAARQAAQATEFAWRNGAAALLDWLDAQRTLHAVELEAATAQADLARAFATLQAAYQSELLPAP